LPAADARPLVFWVLVVLIASAGAVAFGQIGSFPGTDVYLHGQFVVDCIENRFLPGAFLYFLVIGSATLFTTDLPTILFASALILGLATAARFVATVDGISAWIGAPADGRSRAILWAAGAGLLILFCLPQPGSHWMAGQFPANLWHNATYSFLMPFAVLLFFRSLSYLEHGRAATLYSIGGLIVLNVLIKPSFFLCVAPIFPLFALARFGFRPAFFRACLPVAVGGAIMALQYLFIYHSPWYDDVTEAGGASIGLGWFYPWREWTDNIALSIVNSLLLPLLYLVAYPRSAALDRGVRYGWALMLLALGIYAFVYESGTRALHGNFGWQASACNYVLHVAVVAAFLRDKRASRSFGRFDWVLVALFLVEVLSGLAYVGKLVWTGKYL
jgi:hypothetical protein